MSIRAIHLVFAALVTAFAALPSTSRATAAEDADRASQLATLATWAASPIAGMSCA